MAEGGDLVDGARADPLELQLAAMGLAGYGHRLCDAPPHALGGRVEVAAEGQAQRCRVEPTKQPMQGGLVR
jgi:hypothetical protein